MSGEPLNPAQVWARDGVDGHPCIRVEAYMAMVSESRRLAAALAAEQAKVERVRAMARRLYDSDPTVRSVQEAGWVIYDALAGEGAADQPPSPLVHRHRTVSGISGATEGSP